MLVVPPFGGWGYTTTNHTTRPANSMGESITPGASNAMGAVTTLSISPAVDCHGMLISINTANVSTQARDTLVDIMVDQNGGTSWSVLIPTLLGLGGSEVTGAIHYWFPLAIKAGSSLGARAQVNNATAGSLNIWMTLFGQPQTPVRAGTYVEAVGVNTAASCGQAAAAGTTSDGAWTLLGTPSRRCWFWQLGMGCNNTVMNSVSYVADLASGDGTNFNVIFADQYIAMNSTEALGWPATFNGQRDLPAGVSLYGRLQMGSASPTANISLACWGVGG